MPLFFCMFHTIKCFYNFPEHERGLLCISHLKIRTDSCSSTPSELLVSGDTSDRIIFWKILTGSSSSFSSASNDTDADISTNSAAAAAIEDDDCRYESIFQKVFHKKIYSIQTNSEMLLECDKIGGSGARSAALVLIRWGFDNLTVFKVEADWYEYDMCPASLRTQIVIGCR